MQEAREVLPQNVNYACLVMDVCLLHPLQVPLKAIFTLPLFNRLLHGSDIC